MSTPTPPYSSYGAHHPSPNIAAKKPGAQHATTPSHFNQSSPPRSVPSPAATRKDQAGRTPVNYYPTNTTGGSSQGSKNIAGGTPMMQGLSQQGYGAGMGSTQGFNMNTASTQGLGNTPSQGFGTTPSQGFGASPSAHMLSFGTPGAMGLGVDMGTPGQLNMSTPAALAAVGMVPSMSELGLGLPLTTSAGKRNEEEERKARMRRILKSIGRPKGRVSEEGIARVSRRVGFANDIDAEKLTAEEKERRVGNRTISIAGNTLVIDVELKNHAPMGVQVMLSSALPGAEEQALKAGKVLLGDLKREGRMPLEATLDRFATNLGRLARIDKLSSERINCFDALSGVYGCLERLWEQEKKSVREKEEEGLKDDFVEVEVLCKKSGKPVIHESGRLGLSIEYWRKRHANKTNAGDTAMEIDNEHQEHLEDAIDAPYALRIDTEQSSADLYPALHVSDQWLPNPLELPTENSGQSIPWQDPAPTILTLDNDGANSMNVVGAQKLPDLRFIAKLDPPLVVPWQVATNILSSLGAPTPQAFTTPQLYHTLLLNGRSAPLTVEQMILSMGDGEEKETKHAYRLNVAKHDFGYKLDELPFSHPRQLVELLPVLRSWVVFGALLKHTFTAAGPEAANLETSDGMAEVNGASQVSLDDVMTDGAPSLTDTLQVDVELSTSPVPTLAVLFPLQDGRQQSATVQVLANGEIGSIGEKTDALPFVTGSRFAKALDLCYDLGIAIDWVRARGTP